MEKYDAIVVGGGPIGGNISKLLSEKSIQVALLEQNKQIAQSLKCAGLITPRIFDLLKIPKEKTIQNTIKGSNIHSPNGTILKIGGDKKHAYVIDRIKFDKEIVKKAEKNKADIHLNSKVVSFQRQNNKIILTTDKKKEYSCKLLIGADGPHSKIRDRFLLPTPTEYLKGIGAEIKDTSLDSNFVEIFVGNNIAPGFFAWIIPTNQKGTTARIGLCTTNTLKPPKYYFNNFYKNKELSSFFKNTTITKKIGGTIPLGYLKKTYQKNVMILGDAACHVKPTSGGGIYPGLKASKHCADTAIDAFRKNDFSTNFLKKYQKLWTKDIGREIYFGMKFRKIFRNISDKQLDKYIQKFQNDKIVEIINKYGDIDHPSKLVKPLFKKTPSLLKLIPNMIKD